MLIVAARNQQQFCAINISRRGAKYSTNIISFNSINEKRGELIDSVVRRSTSRSATKMLLHPRNILFSSFGHWWVKGKRDRLGHGGGNSGLFHWETYESVCFYFLLQINCLRKQHAPSSPPFHFPPFLSSNNHLCATGGGLGIQQWTKPGLWTCFSSTGGWREGRGVSHKRLNSGFSIEFSIT